MSAAMRPSSNHKRCFIVLVLLMLIGSCLKLTKAQEFPNPLYVTNQFNASVSFRQDVCDRHDRYWRREIAFRDALEGLELRTIMRTNQYFELREDGSIDPEYPGLTGILLDELARRAKFTWRNSFVALGTPIDGRSFTELLQWATEAYDVSVNWWTWSTERRSLGINFPAPWYDSSIIMVGPKMVQDDSKFNPWSWLAPFDLGVWIMILVTIVISGLIYFFLEVFDDMTDKQELRHPMNGIFLAGITFTSHFEFCPRTSPAQLLTFSLSFWAMLTGAAYTANLASFLVVKNTPQLEVNTINDAVRLGLRMCVYGNTAADDLVTDNFPHANLLRKQKEEEIFVGVHNNECALAITTISSWKFWERNKDTNPGCGLEWIGRTFKQRPAGFATLHDSGYKCTSLINDVINIHLNEMEEDNFIEDAWKNHVERTATIDQCWDASSTNYKDTSQLNLKNMGGIFVLHFALTAFAVLMFICFKYCGYLDKRNKEVANKEEQAELQKLLKKDKLAAKYRMSQIEHGKVVADARQAVGETQSILTETALEQMIDDLSLRQTEMQKSMAEKLKAMEEMQQTQMSTIMNMLKEKENEHDDMVL